MRECSPPIPISPHFSQCSCNTGDVRAHPRAPQCRNATFQRVSSPGFQPFFLSGRGMRLQVLVIPTDRVDWHLAGAGQSQDTGGQQPGQHSSPEPSGCSCSLSAPWGRCQPGPFPAARHLTPGTARWHLLLPTVESRTLWWEKAGEGGDKAKGRIPLGYNFFFLGFELVLSCKSCWQHLLERVSCSPTSGCGSLGFMSGSLLLRAAWLSVLSQGVSWALVGQIILCPFPSWVLALLDVLK